MIRQARAQARTAVQLARIHPHWRTYLATGINPVQRAYFKAARGLHAADRLRKQIGELGEDRALSDRELRAARALAGQAYFEELERSLQ
jgi:hypothetical protein